MAESNRSGDRWILIAGAVVALGFGGWLILGGSPDSRQDPSELAEPVLPSAPPAQEGASPEVATTAPRIAEGGRLSLDAADIPAGEPLALGLDLGDEDRGEGERSVRIISVDGRRLDAVARPFPGAGSGVGLEIESGFLSSGRYLIEIDTVGPGPLQIRRYVLEVR